MGHAGRGDFAHVLGHYRVDESYLGGGGKFIVFTQGVHPDETQLTVMFLVDKTDSTLPRQMLTLLGGHFLSCNYDVFIQNPARTWLSLLGIFVGKLIVCHRVSVDEAGEALDKIFNQYLQCEGCLPEEAADVHLP